MRKYKKLESMDIIKAIKVYAKEIDSIENIFEYFDDADEAFKYYKENEMEITWLSRDDDELGNIRNFKLDNEYIYDQFDDEEEAYDDYAKRHDLVYNGYVLIFENYLRRDVLRELEDEFNEIEQQEEE